jgi:uncharacterized protein
VVGGAEVAVAGDEAMLEAWPLPVTDDPDDAGFWAAARRGELVVQACGACGHRTFPPRPMCPRCRSVERVWETVSGRARIWTWVVAHPPLLPVFQPMAPYAVVVVALDEDPAIRMVGNLVAAADAPIDSVDAATIRFGEPVEAVFVLMADDVSLVRWVRAEG